MRPFFARLRSLARTLRSRADVNADMADEFRFHFEERVDHLIALGSSPAEAARTARAEFGSVARYQEEGRASRGLRAWDELDADVRYAVRTLLRNRVFAGAAIVTLALGIGATAAIFSVVDAVLLRPLPFPEAHELVTFARVPSDATSQGIAAARYDDYRAWQAPLRAFNSVAGYTTSVFSVTGGSEPVRAHALAIDGDLLHTLGVAPVTGRGIAADDVASRAQVVLLTHAFWRRYFGAGASAVGSTVQLDGAAFEIIGVLPEDFDFPPATRSTEGWSRRRSDIVVPLSAVAADEIAYYPFYMIGRLAPGALIEQARAELDNVAAGRNPAATEHSTHVTPLHDAVFGPLRPALYAFSAAVALVLLIACANLAALLYARLGARAHELHLRLTLGAGRGRIARQLLTENLVLSLAGGIAGLAVAWGALQLLVAAAPAELPGIAGATLNVRVLLFTLATSLLTGLLFGLLPVLRTRVDNPAATTRVRAATATRSTRRAHGVLVAAEVALAALLLVGAGLMIRSFGALIAEDSGFSVQGLLTAEVMVPREVEPDRAGVLRYYDDVESRIAAIPGVAAVGAIDRPPFGMYVSHLAFTIPGRLAEPAPGALNTAARPGYFETMRIPLRTGRTFTSRDDGSSTPVVVVSESLARSHWPDGSAVGQRIVAFGAEREIVGVVGDVRHFGPATPPEPMIYLPQAQDAAVRRMMTLVVRTSGDPGRLAGDVRAILRATEPRAAVGAVTAYGSMRAGRVAGERFNALLIGAFSLLALTMAAVGLFGVLTFTVTSRTREIGVRMALGAAQGAVVSGIVGHAMRLVTIGLTVGLLLSVPAAGALRGMLYGVQPADPLTFILAPMALLLVAMAAAWLPARRAARVDPVRALRQD